MAGAGEHLNDPLSRADSFPLWDPSSFACGVSDPGSTDPSPVANAGGRPRPATCLPRELDEEMRYTFTSTASSFTSAQVQAQEVAESAVVTTLPLSPRSLEDYRTSDVSIMEKVNKKMSVLQPVQDFESGSFSRHSRGSRRKPSWSRHVMDVLPFASEQQAIPEASGPSIRATLVLGMGFVALVCCCCMHVVLEVFMQQVLHGVRLEGTSAEYAEAQPWALQVALAKLEEEFQDLITFARVASGCLCAILLAASMALGLCLGTAIARPMGHVTSLLRGLGELNVQDLAMELRSVSRGRRSFFRDVKGLQMRVCQLSRSIEMFARFLPETVVCGIVRGDDTAVRLHVERREVTIMFSDIQDFTAIAESLHQEDLLLLLTRYLDIMIGIVEAHEGVVAEILGDGLLVFWNTPDDVADHAAKACACALAQQRSLGPLNKEFAAIRLPEIAVRVGIHTGDVLTGNIGSQERLKFGCMGDPMNLASRAEGLCKFYGVQVICTGPTFDALPPSVGFFCRKLDLVQVKGRHDPTLIYEVLGFKEPPTDASLFNPMSPTSSGINSDPGGLLANRSRSLSSEAIAGFRALSKRRNDSGRAANAMPSPTMTMADAAAPCLDMNQLGVVCPEVRRTAELYEAALSAYQQADLFVCRELCEALLARNPNDRSAALLLGRAAEHLGGPTGREIVGLSAHDLRNWTGVRIMTEK